MAIGSKIRDFQTDVCEPLAPPSEVKICPTCIPNPDAIVQDWRLSDGEPFLNEKVLPKFNSYTRVRIIDEIINRYQTNFKDLLVGDTITKLIKAPWVLEDIFHELESFVFSNSLVVITSFFYLYN